MCTYISKYKFGSASTITNSNNLAINLDVVQRPKTITMNNLQK